MQLTFGMFPVGSSKMDAARVLRETPPTEQPRARLERLGADALSLTELLHLVLACQNDLLLPARLLAQYPALDDLARAPISDWMLIKGMTTLRAARLQAVLELHKRFATSLPELPIVRTATDAAALLSPAMSVLEQEQMRVLMLNTKNRIIGSTFTVYQGSTHTTVIRVSELFREATRRNATALIIAHNHPSGASRSI
jgi:DNA repair protein RadC